MDRRRRVHWTVAGAIVSIWACTQGGVDVGGQGPPGGKVVGEVLRSVANNAVAPSFAEFSVAAAALKDAADAYAAAPAEDAALQSVRTAFGAAMDAWQVVEVMQLGPAGNSSTAVGGADLRDAVYSWPSVNTCRVDQELYDEAYPAADFIETRLVNAFGLDALEYLLFNDSVDNTCPPQVPLNADGQWVGLGDATVVSRRAAYAAVLATAIAKTADTLADAWAPGSGEYTEFLSDPTAAGSPYKTEGVALNEILRAMFYVDIALKDDKLARPAGIKDCGSATCLDALESPFAGTAKEHVLANLRGFRRLFVGGTDEASATGFDDLLETVGEGALGTTILRDVDAAIAAVEAVEGTFSEALLADEAALDAAHAAVAELTDALKGEFPIVLSLNVPSEAAGDAD